MHSQEGLCPTFAGVARGDSPLNDVNPVPPNTLKKTYIRVAGRQRRGRIEAMCRALAGSILSPAYLILAGLYRAPGLGFRLRCARLGLRLLYGRKAPLSYRDLYGLLFWPMDSVRYFEFEFVWQALRGTSIHNYLDVSSPRLFPIVLVRERPEISATFINPDKGDLQETATLVKACGLDPRCQLRECLIESAPFAPESFDVITSISVVEHIPQDKKAIRKIWDLLRPGGKLFLSVPCAAAAEVEYIDVDFYGVQAADEIGFFFHQYKYDLPLLEERMFSVTGPPVRLGIYGEKTAGVLNRWLLKRWRGEPYPLWKEPYALARNFQRYDSLRELPGDGVIAMEFIKK